MLIILVITWCVYQYNMHERGYRKGTYKQRAAETKRAAKETAWKHEEEMARIALQRQKLDYNAVYGDNTNLSQRG